MNRTHKFVTLVLALLALFSADPALASTQTCGSTVGGTGTELFAFNTGWYGHGCKFTTAGSIDVSAISAEISRIATTQTFALAVYADSGNKPSGSALATGNISSVTANCTVYTATVATTTLTAGTYWITAIPTTHSTAYICGAGSATVSDQDSASSWATGYSGGYYLALTYTASVAPPSSTFSGTTTPPTSAEVQLYLLSYMALLMTVAFFLFFIWGL